VSGAEGTSAAPTAEGAARPLEAADVDAAARALSLAFHDDPCFAYFVREDERRRRLGPDYFRVAIEAARPLGACFTTAGEPRGAALFLPPGRGAISTWAALRTAGPLAPCRFGLGALRRTLATTRDLARLHPAGPHWYLMTLGVDPAAQGRGLGKLLVAPILARAEREGVPVHLETFKRENIAFYERLGFRITAEVRPDRGRCPLGWAMLRGAASTERR
jgi:GNAT superfamily N-acetyltransferase